MKNAEATKTRIICKYSGCRKSAEGATDGTPFCAKHGETIAETSRKLAWSRSSQFHPLTKAELIEGWG